MKKILVTGASSGIGAATTQLLIENQYSVLGLARNFSKLPLTSSFFNFLEIDLSDLKTLPSFLKTLVRDHEEIDTLVLNAAQGLFGFLEQLSYEQILHNLNLNLISQIYIAKAFIPLFKKRKSGTLIFLGSEAALQGKPQGSIYCASKFALRGFVQSLRSECQKSQIRVSLINPGAVKTPFFDTLHFKPKEGELHACQAEEIAKIILHQVKAPTGMVFEEINVAPLQKHITHIFESGT